VVGITEQAKAERDLRQSEARLRRVVENAPMILWAVDAEGVFTLSEGRALRELGLQPGQVVGMSALELYAALPDVLASLRRGLDGEEFTATVEAGGRTFETRYCPMRGDGGAPAGLLGVSVDVTERRNAEEERARLQAQLLQVQKLESVGLLAGGIAHDFNNLLTAILGGASTALLGLALESPARRDVENVLLAARRAADLTRQMLAYSGKGHFEIKPLDLSALVREIATLLETTISKKVQLRLELGGGLPSVQADVAQMQQVIMNLVINGAEAIGDQRGTVLVTTGLQEIDEAYGQTLVVSAGELAPGPYVFIEVHDTGSGMDEATREKIFDPFFSTKFTGRGLGLAAVLGIVRAHKGAIKVYSTPGRGSTFKVFLPATAARAHAPAPSSQAFRGSGVVLVVDDDSLVRETTRSMLEYFGFSVLVGVNGRDGVDVFAARAADIRLVILDMTMPELNGEEAFRELRQIREDVPVILTSGYNEIEATRRFMAKGLAGFLQKPYTPMDLAEKIRGALG
jgi:PAS domain S-box-containing protein